jgi:hypothetical protein
MARPMLEIHAAAVVGSRDPLFGTSLGEADRRGTTTAVHENRPVVARGRPDARRRGRGCAVLPRDQTACLSASCAVAAPRHITKARNRHARRLLVETAWHSRHAPRRPTTGPQPSARARHAQVRLHHGYRHLTEHGKRSTVVTVAIARELAAFLWADLTNQPTREEALAA